MPSGSPSRFLSRRWVGGVAFRALSMLPMLAVSAAFAPAAGAVELVPHHAVYALELAQSSSNSNITGVNGLLEYEWNDSCDGWITNYKAAMRFSRTEGDDVDIGWNLSSWESKDGLSYRFFMKRVEGAKTVEVLRGDATLDKPGGSGAASFKSPEKKTYALAPGTMFPTDHMVRVLEAAAEGKSIFWADLFDGTEFDGPFGLNAIIGEALTPDTPSAFDSPLLENKPSWQMRLAFFSLEDGSAEPTSEQAFRVYSNGIIENLTIDHGDFVIGATLETLEALSAPDC